MPSTSSSPAAFRAEAAPLGNLASAAGATGTGGFGVYVHWPYCVAKCPYCDFNSHVPAGIDHPAWRAAYEREIAHAAATEAPGRRVDSIFFGGGTPSLMPPATVAGILEAIAAHWPVRQDVEVTLEANPSSVEVQAFRELRAAGVNRVSIGVQSLRDEGLQALERQHSVAQAKHAVAAAQSIFPEHSIDLIYGRPGQSPADWDAELADALALAGDHLSLYQLTIEDGTAFAERFRRGELVLPWADALEAMFDLTQDRSAAAGRPAYEISNHARPGAECRHNMVYWLYGEYVGLGPGAHGRVTQHGRKVALRRHRAPLVWLERARRQGHATQGRDVIPESERLVEALLMGLRTTTGLPRARFEAEFGRSPEALLPAEARADLAAAGDLVCDAHGLRATAQGRARLTGLLTYLLPD